MADVKISELTALTSPSGGEELVVNASGTTKKITITNATSASLPKAGGTMTGVIAGFESTGIDDNATSTAVTIDASENVLVGKTTIAGAFNTVGSEIRASGLVQSTVDGSKCIDLNRLSSDGDILGFSKAGTSVGSIGSFSGASYFGGTAGGIMFNGVNQNPTNGTSTRVDNTNDLGASSYRYKDIYLGGGAFLGGTATANKLDDYEEGTWNPTGTGLSTSLSVGTYTKIGNTVHIHASVRTNGTNLNIFGGLPFTPATGNNAGNGSCGHVGAFEITTALTTGMSILVNSSNEFFVTSTWKDSGNRISVGSYAFFSFTGTYKTT